LSDENDHGQHKGDHGPLEALPGDTDKLVYTNPVGGDGSGPQYSIPEPWAVGLALGPDRNILNQKRTIKATCQFNRLKGSGIRLNTPLSLQGDQSDNLESPLDYPSYQGKHHIPIFTLEQSFGGFDSVTTSHYAGCGFLKISRLLEEKSDHRVCSWKTIPNNGPGPNPTAEINDGIKCLGINLATLKGYGWMSVRIKLYEIWMDTNSQAYKPEIIVGTEV
jgi:hypothetical protein